MRGNKKGYTVADDAYSTNYDSESGNEVPSDDQYLYLDKDYNAILNLSDLFHVISENFSIRSSMNAEMISLLNEFVICCTKRFEDVIKKLYMSNRSLRSSCQHYRSCGNR